VLNKADARGLISKATSNLGLYAVAQLTASDVGTTRFANSQISQNVVISDISLTLTVYDGSREATCTTNVLTEKGIKKLQDNAKELLKHVPEGDAAIFTFSTDEIGESIASGALAKAFDTEQRVAMIKSGDAMIEEGFYSAGALELTTASIAVGNTNGGFRYSSYEFVTFNTVVTHAQTGAAGSGAVCSYTTIPDILSAFKKAQETAIHALSPVSAPLGAHTVILSPTAFGNLINFVATQHNAKAVGDGISYATGKLDTTLFDKKLTIRDEPGHAQLRPILFDLEGNPRLSLDLVREGVVKNYLYDNKTAAKSGTLSTGHAAGRFPGGMALNLVVDAGDVSQEAMISSTAKGIYINEFHYTNFVNARMLQITGLTRNGAFLIEDGKITKPIGTVRFTESMLSAFQNITALSAERELVTGYAPMLVPAAKIEKFHFTSKA